MHLSVKRGSEIVLKDLITNPPDTDYFKVNYKGYVGNKLKNDGEDRGYTIDTARDLMVGYSVNKRGRTYPIIVNYRGKKHSHFYIDLED